MCYGSLSSKVQAIAADVFDRSDVNVCERRNRNYVALNVNRIQGSRVGATLLLLDMQRVLGIEDSRMCIKKSQ